MSQSTLEVLRLVYYLSFFFVPFFLVVTLFDLWLVYKRMIWIAKQTYIMLEIKVPKEVFKSPKAMEFFIAGLSKGSNETTWIDRLWKGQTRPQFSLEIVSIDGGVHFFVRTRKWLQGALEANLYSQYPGVEVHEVPDYTLPVKYDPETVGLWGTEFALSEADVFPIKTYVDYGMDKDPKEEFKIDPLTPFIEYIASLGRGHQMWFQIIVRSHKAEYKDPETGKMIDKKWKKDAEVQIKKILENAKGEKGEDGKYSSSRYLTQAEQDKITALDRSISKVAFDVGMRFIYTAPKDIFVGTNVSGAMGGIMNFNAPHLNGFKPVRDTGGKYNYPWQDKNKKKTNKEKVKMLDAYKKRGYFYNENKRPYFVLNTEELATIFHLPGQVSTTPTLERVESRKIEAPANLPI